jgi:hypothetical protein
VSFALIFVGQLLAGVLLLVAAYVVRGRRDLRPDLSVADGSLVAYESVAFHVLAALGTAALTGAWLYDLLTLLTSGRHDPAGPAAALVCGFLTVGFGLPTVIFAVCAVKPPAVVIRADGVVIRTARRATLIDWAVVIADHDSLYAAGLRGITTSDTPPRWPPLSATVDLRHLDVPPRRVVDAIVRYRDNADERAGIGTAASSAPAPREGEGSSWAEAAWKSTAWHDGERAAD